MKLCIKKNTVPLNVDLTCTSYGMSLNWLIIQLFKLFYVNFLLFSVVINSMQQKQWFLTVGNQSFFSHWCALYFLTIHWKSMRTVPITIFGISLFMFHGRKKVIQVCSNMKMSKWWYNFSADTCLGITYQFKHFKVLNLCDFLSSVLFWTLLTINVW